MKIVSDFSCLGDDNTIVLDEIICKYVQNPDSTESQDEYQEIVISSRDAGGGKFINISTKSWSIDDIGGITLILEDFKNRMK